MFWIFYSMIILNVSVFTFALIFLYIFKKTHEKYIGYWGASWILYGIGLLIEVILFGSVPILYMIIAQQFIYSISVLLLLAGTYSFLDKDLSRNWIYLMAANLLWGVGSAILGTSYLIMILPLSLSFSLIAIYTGIQFLQNWDIEGLEKTVTGIVFLIWGIHRSYYFYLNPDFTITPSGYIIEILLIIALNACLFLIFLQKNRLRLIKNEQIFRLLTENSQDLIYLCLYDSIQYFEYVSPNSEKIIGYKPDEFYANPYLLDEIVHPDDKPLYDLTLNPSLSPKDAVTLRYRHKDGHYLWVEEYSTLVYDSAGNVFGLEGVIRDVTEKKLMTEASRHSELERQALLSAISHELKTPITTMRGNIEAILDGKIPPGEGTEKYLLNIRNKTVLMERLISDLFQLSQLENNQFSFNFSLVGAAGFFTDAFNRLGEDVRQSSLNFDSFVDPRLGADKPELIVDIERMEQVLYNLVYNAIKNSPPDGRVTLRCLLKNKETLQIEVEDTGIGIQEADLHHIFERFYKVPDNPADGSGLGLAIVSEILAKHHAAIRAESAPGKGTKFIISMPLDLTAAQ